MSLPFFFAGDLSGSPLVLDEDNSRHMVGVLRMQQGDRLLLTDGRGKKAEAVISDDHKKRCMVTIVAVETTAPPQPHLAIAISLIKNTSRFEWFLEKATEIGVNEILPLLCDRTEKEKFRFDRMRNILVSAMLQSQQCWLPHLHEPIGLKDLVARPEYDHRLIAHCGTGEKKKAVMQPDARQLMLIGPEGDFSPKEIELALSNGFVPVSLGNTRLRTETAGIVAATLLKLS